MSLKACVTVVLGSLICVAAGCGESPSNNAAKFPVEQTVGPADRADQNTDEARQPNAAVAADAPADRPVSQTVHYQPTGEASDEAASVPPVLLTKHHAALCRVKVGDAIPEIELPKIGGGKAKLADLYGKAATVVVFWKSDRRMASDELADLGPDVEKKFGSRGVAVVGIVVEMPEADAHAVLEKAEATFANLSDADGKAFARVGTQKLPWTLLLDAQGKIVWFDIEYSHATRRELQQALRATAR